jgi:hypothetical protein
VVNGEDELSNCVGAGCVEFGEPKPSLLVGRPLLLVGRVDGKTGAPEDSLLDGSLVKVLEGEPSVATELGCESLRGALFGKLEGELVGRFPE